jgi:hypothetical protein
MPPPRKRRFAKPGDDLEVKKAREEKCIVGVMDETTTEDKRMKNIIGRAI